MAERAEKEPAVEALTGVPGVRNLGEPLRFQNVEQLAGFVAEPVKAGQTANVWTRFALTSDEPLFHCLVENLEGIIRHMAQMAGTPVNLRLANTVLLIIRPDSSAELWVDTAAVALRCAIKRPSQTGMVLFESDIADVTAMSFPCVTLGEKDKVACIFRVDWSFGLAFDFNPYGVLDVDSFFTTLGTLHRILHYRHLYEAVANPAVFDRLMGAGWFPFVEIVTAEFRELVRHCESGFDIAEIEGKIIEAFDAARLGHLSERWLTKPHFAAKAALFEEAIEAFIAQKPASVIKIVLTEIEGVLNDAYRAAHEGAGAKLKTLLAFAQTSAEQRAGAPDTLFFPAAFGRYLEVHTFAKFDPVAQTGTAGSRHAVGHGAAAQETYTMTRALQAILTLDQLAFYT